MFVGQAPRAKSEGTADWVGHIENYVCVILYHRALTFQSAQTVISAQRIIKELTLIFTAWAVLLLGGADACTFAPSPPCNVLATRAVPPSCLSPRPSSVLGPVRAPESL